MCRTDGRLPRGSWLHSGRSVVSASFLSELITRRGPESSPGTKALCPERQPRPASHAYCESQPQGRFIKLSCSEAAATRPPAARSGGPSASSGCCPLTAPSPAPGDCRPPAVNTSQASGSAARWPPARSSLASLDNLALHEGPAPTGRRAPVGVMGTGLGAHTAAFQSAQHPLSGCPSEDLLPGSWTPSCLL